MADIQGGQKEDIWREAKLLNSRRSHGAQ